MKIPAQQLCLVWRRLLLPAQSLLPRPTAEVKYSYSYYY